jgi:hypothetical protein
MENPTDGNPTTEKIEAAMRLLGLEGGPQLPR